MRRAFTFLVIFAMLAMCLSVAVTAEGKSIRYTVVFSGKGIPKKVANLVAEAGGELVRTFPEIGVGIAVSNDPNFADSLRDSKKIHSVGMERSQSLPPTEVMEINYITESGPDPTTDFLYLFQWNIRRTKADQAWSVTTGSHNTVVAVIDTGIAWNHPDLAPNVVHYDCYSSTNSCVDYPDASYNDEGYHGTQVAGIIAAVFGGGGVVGVGPDLGLASYKVFEQIPDCGYCAYDDSIWRAMLDAVARGYEVINMSLGSFIVFPEEPENAANWTAWNRVANYVTQQGVTIVAAAGNFNFDLNGPVAHVPSDLPGVISVGATGIRPDPLYPQSNAYDVRAYYSNFGAATTLVAPGGDFGPPGTPFPYPGGFYLVPTTFVAVPGTPPNITPWTPGYDPGCEVIENCPVGYFFVGGTSISSPHVAGTAAMVIDQNPNLNPHQVEAILKRTAENLGDRQQFGHGMVDAAAAVNE